MSGPVRRDAGFSIMEALVALAIVAMGLAVFAKAAGDSFRAASRIRVNAAALASTRSHLDAIGQNGALQDGVFTGRYGNDLPWRLTVQALAGNARDAAQGPRPFWIVLETFDRRGVRLVKLETAKLSVVVPP